MTKPCATTAVPSLVSGEGVRTPLRDFWRTLRTLTGDDAYEQYCAHHRLHHPNQPPLDRREFYVKHQQEKWSGINRCC